MSSKILDNQIQQKLCYFCNQNCISLVTFSCCNHQICNLCLFERIFSKYINKFQGINSIKINCKCEVGFLNQRLSNIFELLKLKNELDEKQRDEGYSEDAKKIIEGCDCKNDKERKGKKFSEFFCVDCLKFICKKCKSDINNPHFNHRILRSKHLIKSLKENGKNFAKDENFDSFSQKFDYLSDKFEDMIDNNFNNTIKLLDELIESANILKENYIKEYKTKLGEFIQNFKIIKIFYLNYFKDREKEFKNIEAEKSNIYRLKYLNNISYEFFDFQIEQSDFVDKEVKKIKQIMDNMITKDSKLIKGEFIFNEIKKGFKIDEVFQAHQKYIHEIAVTNNPNNIVTISHDYTMKIWEPNSVKVPKQEEKMEAHHLLSLKNGKFLIAKNNDIYVYKLDSNKKYINCQSITNHSKNITSLWELEDGTLVSGGEDKKIILYDEKDNQYQLRQTINCGKEIDIIISLNDFKIAYSGQDDGIISILETIPIMKENKLISGKYSELCKLPPIKGIVNCLCYLNQGFFVCGGRDKKTVTDNNIYLWKSNGNKYILSQTKKKAHISDVNSIILLRDGRFASASRDHTIKIWKIEWKSKENIIKFDLVQSLDQFKHAMNKLIQLNDDRIIATSSQFQFVFWNNTNSIFE